MTRTDMQMKKKADPPVIIISTMRSGTRMLRDTIVKLPGFCTWPSDEINYIWRHGNALQTTDELSEELATPKVSKYIRNTFEKLSKQHDYDRVIEKTPHNSLRVKFVNSIFPEAKFIFNTRDGRDSVSSAIKRYNDPFDLSHTLNQAKCIPLTDIPYYALRYFYRRSYRFFTKEKRDAVLGPIYNGMKDDFKKYSLAEVCALQWLQCVEKAEKDLSQIAPERIFRIRYEDFVTNPVFKLKQLGDFLGLQFSEQLLKDLSAGIHSKSIGKGRKSIDPKTAKLIEIIMGDKLKQYGYH
jgi:hypothetical protein